MASASLFITTSLPLPRVLQCTTTSHRRGRRFASPRCDNAHNQPLLKSAQHRAARRAAESPRNEPLFHDPYAVCLAAEDDEVAEQAGYYEVATRFIDEEVMGSVKSGGENPTQQRGCMLRHISVELSENGDWTDASWERNLVSVGYQGTRPNIWAMQGLQTLTREGLEIILRCVSSLGMKDSVFLGELPFSALGDISQENIRAELCRVFGSHGFHVSVVPHKEIATTRPLTEMNGQGIGVELLFVAKQLRLSDHQVDDLKRMSSDKEMDEEGFEDW